MIMKSKNRNSYLNGVKILGDRDAIAEIVERENIDVILFAIAKDRWGRKG